MKKRGTLTCRYWSKYVIIPICDCTIWIVRTYTDTIHAYFILNENSLKKLIDVENILRRQKVRMRSRTAHKREEFGIFLDARALRRASVTFFGEWIARWEDCRQLHIGCWILGDHLILTFAGTTQCTFSVLKIQLTYIFHLICSWFLLSILSSKTHMAQIYAEHASSWVICVMRNTGEYVVLVEIERLKKSPPPRNGKNVIIHLHKCEKGQRQYWKLFGFAMYFIPRKRNCLHN